MTPTTAALAAPTLGALVLTCGSRNCQHTLLSCPRCGGWTFQAALVEPATEGGAVS